jgi:hypothetical protein
VLACSAVCGLQGSSATEEEEQKKLRVPRLMQFLLLLRCYKMDTGA